MLKLTIAINPIDYDRALGVLYDLGITSFVEEERRTETESVQHLFEIYLKDVAQAERIADLVRSSFSGFLPYSVEVQELEDDDWETRWKTFWKPEKILPGLIICPGWERYEAAPGENVIYIDTTNSFGTGGHESTRLALRLMADEVKQLATARGSFLDIGCGSGVLSIYARMLGFAPVQGIDIEETAVQNARQNALRNEISDIEYRKESASHVREKCRVVAANMISSQLIENWEGIIASVSPGGRLLLSGLLSSEIDQFCFTQRLAPTARVEEGEWGAILVDFP